MVVTVYIPAHGRKWWLLRNGRILCGGGILLLFLLPVLCIYLMIVVSFSVFGWIALVILFIADILWIKHASCYRTLYCMAEELGLTLEDFDPLRLIIKVRKGTRSYFILPIYELLQYLDSYDAVRFYMECPFSALPGVDSS